MDRLSMWRRNVCRSVISVNLRSRSLLGISLTARGQKRSLNFETVRKDGTILPVISSATAIRDSDGNYMMSRSTVYDITELKRAEEQLRLSHEQLRNLYAHLH